METDMPDPDMKNSTLYVSRGTGCCLQTKVPEQIMLMIKESDDFYTKPFANQENLAACKAAS